MPANDAEGVQDLRRSLRDLIALTMLPTVWAGYEPRQICADLVNVVARMIDADGVYLTSPLTRLSGVLRLAGKHDGEAARMLRETGNGPEEAGSGTDVQAAALRLLSSPLSFQMGGRFVVAARRRDFPNEMERLVLRVAVNQAATWLEWKRAEADGGDGNGVPPGDRELDARRRRGRRQRRTADLRKPGLRDDGRLGRGGTDRENAAVSLLAAGGEVEHRERSA